MKKWCRRILTGVLILGILGGLAALGASLYVVKTTEAQILAPDAAVTGAWDCVLVLGAGVRPDGSPSDMLYDRVRTGLDLYHGGAAPKLLMSGDHGRSEYDEVGCMLGLALEDGVAAADVFLDHDDKISKIGISFQVTEIVIYNLQIVQVDVAENSFLFLLKKFINVLVEVQAIVNTSACIVICVACQIHVLFMFSRYI